MGIVMGRGAAPETPDRKAQLEELIHTCDIAYMLRGHDERYFALGRAIGFLKDLRSDQEKREIVSVNADRPSRSING